MKRFLISSVVALAGFTAAADAATLTWGTHTSPYEFSGRTTNWDQNIESESGAVTKVGSYFDYNVDGGATPWGSGTWLFSGYLQMTFSVLADTLFAQFQSDTNDGIAEFVVDGVSVGSLNTYNRGWFQVKISDLALGYHTLQVHNRSADLAFDNFGALATPSPVPLPAGLPLLLSGLAGLAFWRRRNTT